MLLNNEFKKKIPKLYEQENNSDPTVYCKFFALASSWSWYVLEFDGVDTFFGWVDGSCPELGYFSLKELESLNWNGIPQIERDIYFEPTPLSKVKS